MAEDHDDHDDDDKVQRHTLDSLFDIYCNYRAISAELENEVYHTILLSQIDVWMQQAKLMPVPFTRTQTGLIYMHFKKWRLGYEDFLEMLKQLCAQNNLNIDEIKEKLIDAGVPTGAEIVVVK